MSCSKSCFAVLLFLVIVLFSTTACTTGNAGLVQDSATSTDNSLTINDDGNQLQQQPTVEHANTEETSVDIEQRLEEAYQMIHRPGSAEYIRKNFNDIELVYTDEDVPAMAPKHIYPFRYYYSKKADTTFNICNVDISVFICDGKLDKKITKEDVESGKCVVANEYKPMLGIIPFSEGAGAMQQGMIQPGMMPPSGMAPGMMPPPGMAPPGMVPEGERHEEYGERNDEPH